MDFYAQLDRPYAGLPLWAWITGGAMLFGVGWHFYKAKQKAATTSAANASGNPNASTPFNYPTTLDQTGNTGSLNATVGQLAPQDYWPYNQLVPMSQMALPSYPGSLYNPLSVPAQNMAGATTPNG